MKSVIIVVIFMIVIVAVIVIIGIVVLPHVALSRRTVRDPDQPALPLWLFA